MAEDPRKPIRDPKSASDAPVKEPPPQKPPVEEPEKVEDDLNEDDRFDAEYADSQRPLRSPATELMLTMLPSPAARIACASACMDR